MSAPDLRGRPVVPRWVAPVFGGLGLLTIPWVAHLALTLPARSMAGHYRAAWVGLDAMLVFALLRTAYLAWRGRDDVSVPAAVTATLLVVDAWFDVMTAHGPRGIATAVAMALFIELPLATVCLWLARHAELVRAEQLRFLRRSLRRSQAPQAPPPAQAPQAPQGPQSPQG